MKKKQWEPDALTAIVRHERLVSDAVYFFKAGEPLVVLREKDLQRLLKLARKGQTSKRTRT